MSTTKIEFPLQVEDGHPPISFESLNARPVEDGRVEIRNTPFFSENVAYGDVVIALRHQDGRVVFDAVVKFSGLDRTRDRAGVF